MRVLLQPFLIKHSCFQEKFTDPVDTREGCNVEHEVHIIAHRNLLDYSKKFL